MTLKTLAAAACLSIGTATAGLAATVTVTVDGIGYDVTTITGTFSDNEDLLMGQVWWGDSAVASDFANSVAESLGFPNNNGFTQVGPLFADSSVSIFVESEAFFMSTLDTDELFVFANQSATYAIASPVSAVPLPAGGLLLVSAFGGIAALKRRKKGSA